MEVEIGGVKWPLKHSGCHYLSVESCLPRTVYLIFVGFVLFVCLVGLVWFGLTALGMELGSLGTERQAPPLSTLATALHSLCDCLF